MKKLLAIVVVFGLVGAAPVPSNASPMRWCGALSVNGYEDLANISSRNVVCSTTRHVVYQLYKHHLTGTHCDSFPRSDCSFRASGWSVKTHWFRSGSLYALDIRATASGERVVRTQLVGE